MPEDTTPHGGEAFHELPDRARIPEPKPGAESGLPTHETPAPQARDIADRPGLPTDPTNTAVDIEDEEADPVVESGPGVDRDTREKSAVRQPGEH